MTNATKGGWLYSHNARLGECRWNRHLKLSWHACSLHEDNYKFSCFTMVSIFSHYIQGTCRLCTHILYTHCFNVGPVQVAVSKQSEHCLCYIFSNFEFLIAWKKKQCCPQILADHILQFEIAGSNFVFCATTTFCQRFSDWVTLPLICAWCTLHKCWHTILCLCPCYFSLNLWYFFSLLAVATTGTWDILNPELITVPNPGPDMTHPIRCLTLVKNRLWIGTGPFLAFVEMDSLVREVWIVMGCKLVVCGTYNA